MLADSYSKKTKTGPGSYFPALLLLFTWILSGFDFENPVCTVVESFPGQKTAQRVCTFDRDPVFSGFDPC